MPQLVVQHLYVTVMLCTYHIVIQAIIFTVIAFPVTDNDSLVHAFVSVYICITLLVNAQSFVRNVLGTCYIGL